jgi:hypothetical protein
VFCIGCGSALGTAAPSQAYNKPVPAEMLRPVKKKNIAALALCAISVVLAIALALSLTGVIAISGASGASAASKSFSSPEDAINYFVERLRLGDFNGALSACAIDEMAKGFDYEAFAERLKAIPSTMMSYLPSEYEQYVEYNKYRLTQQIMIQMACFSVSFNIAKENGELLEGTTVMLEDGKLREGFIEELDPNKISGLKLADIGKHRMHDDQQNRENQKKQASIFGADDVQFRTVLYEYEDKYYMGGFTLIEYGGRWLLQSMSDPLSGIPMLGTPIEIKDKSEFYDMLK